MALAGLRGGGAAEAAAVGANAALREMLLRRLEGGAP
jgi:hypothetical protein